MLGRGRAGRDDEGGPCQCQVSGYEEQVCERSGASCSCPFPLRAAVLPPSEDEWDFLREMGEPVPDLDKVGGLSSIHRQNMLLLPCRRRSPPTHCGQEGVDFLDLEDGVWTGVPSHTIRLHRAVPIPSKLPESNESSSCFVSMSSSSPFFSTGRPLGADFGGQVWAPTLSQ